MALIDTADWSIFLSFCSCTCSRLDGCFQRFTQHCFHALLSTKALTQWRHHVRLLGPWHAWLLLLWVEPWKTQLMQLFCRMTSAFCDAGFVNKQAASGILCFTCLCLFIYFMVVFRNYDLEIIARRQIEGGKFPSGFWLLIPFDDCVIPLIIRCQFLSCL